MKRTFIITTLAFAAVTGNTWAQGSNSAPNFTIAQAISDEAQRTTLAFDGLGMIGGNLDAQSFFPPGKVADYTGFQNLRDTAPDNMGHNTSFMTRIANNVLYVLNDAPAVGHEGYSISETLTVEGGVALCDSSKGYVSANQAALFDSLVDLQRHNLYAGATNIVQLRREIATALRSLMGRTPPTDAHKAQVQALVLTKSATYGELDGENVYHYASVFAQLNQSLTDSQKTSLTALRKSFMAGTYTDGTPFDYSICTTPFLYSAPITDPSVLTPYIADTDYLFDVISQTNGLPAIVLTPAVANPLLAISNQFVIVAGETNIFTATAVDLNGLPLTFQRIFGDNTTNAWTTASFAAHRYSPASCGTYVARVTASNGSVQVSSNLTVIAACQLTVTRLQATLSFVKTNADTIALIAQLDLPGLTNVTQLAGTMLLVDVGDIQVPFNLDARGRGISSNGTCRLIYTKQLKTRPGYWTASLALSKGAWHTALATYGLDNETVHARKITIPVLLMLGNEAFAAERQLTYTATQNKTGTAR